MWKITLKAIARGWLDDLETVVKAHTVWRLRSVWHVATFPLYTNRADDVKLWRATVKVAWRGLLARNPKSLEYFVGMRKRLEESRRFMRAAAKGGLEVHEVGAMRDEHVEAVMHAPRRPVH